MPHHLSESSIIHRYFARSRRHSPLTDLGIGDDGALLSIPSGHQLVSSIDTLNEGCHFFKDVPPFDLGYKSLAVSVSDMAAMAAQPSAALLSLSLVQVDADWLQAFSAGFFKLADALSIDLVGGDLVQGPVAVTTVLHGIVPRGQALCRHAAAVGDLVYVSGTLGDAGFALQCLLQGVSPDGWLLSRLTRPTPRIDIALALRGVATAALDISDGLMLDLTRLCQASGVAARIELDYLPLSAALRQHCALSEAQQLALSAGDDYELLFTVPPSLQSSVECLSLHTRLTCIGELVTGQGVCVYDRQGQAVPISDLGYQHF